MAITIPELNSVSVVDDTDNIMLTHSNGNSEKISGSAFKADMIKNKIENNNGHAVSVNAVSTIMATSTTITGPELGAGGNIKILFTSAIAGVDTSTGLTLTYNGSPIAVKVGKNGALVDFCAYEVTTGVYRYLQAYTTLELIFDGTQFIIVGIPNIDNAPTEDSDNLVKSGGVYDAVKTTIKKENFENLTLICSATGTGNKELYVNINNFSLVVIGVSLNSNAKRLSVQLIPTLLIRYRDSADNSVTVTNYVNSTAYISFMFHYVDNTHIYIDQVIYSQSWASDARLNIWGIK